MLTTSKADRIHNNNTQVVISQPSYSENFPYSSLFGMASLENGMWPVKNQTSISSIIGGDRIVNFRNWNMG